MPGRRGSSTSGGGSGRSVRGSVDAVRSKITAVLLSGADDTAREEYLSDYLADFVDRSGSLRSFLLRQRWRTVSALIALWRLPVVTAPLGRSVDADAIRLGLSRSVSGRTFLHRATGVLSLPTDPGDYLLGRSKQTLRRKLRSAQRLGVRWRTVDDPAERSRLLELARAQERAHPQEVYRRAEPTNDDLLDFDLWLLAVGPQDQPLLLSVTPVDGEWALLRYFRTLGVGDAHSDSRYLLTQVLVEQLAGRGVRYLADTVSPFRLPGGLRHFQRMLGFRTVQVVITGPVGHSAAIASSASMIR